MVIILAKNGLLGWAGGCLMRFGCFAMLIKISFSSSTQILYKWFQIYLPLSRPNPYNFVKEKQIHIRLGWGIVIICLLKKKGKFQLSDPLKCNLTSFWCLLSYQLLSIVVFLRIICKCRNRHLNMARIFCYVVGLLSTYWISP